MVNTKTFSIIPSTFNKMYATVNSIDIMPNYSEFKPEIMHYLRQAFYYELYGDTYKLVIKNNKLPDKKPTYEFVNYLHYALYDDVINDKFIPVKMALYAKHLMPKQDYELSNRCTSDFQEGLKRATAELHTATNKIESYTLDALFSDYPFFIESGLTNYAMQNAKHTREIQQRVNKYITQKGHSQIAYELGLIAPNGYDNQRITLPYGLFQQKFITSKLQRSIALIYQEINGWTPMDLKVCSVINRLPMNPESKYWYDSIVFLSGDISDKTDNPTQENIRSAFTLGSPDLHNLSMDPVCHLTTSSSEVVQAFYLDNTNPNNYKIHTIQEHIDKPMLSLTSEEQTVIRTGVFNPNEIDSTFHMPNCVLQDNIVLNNHRPVINSNDESKWPETQKINAHLVAHTQTLAPVGNDQFLIGIYGDNSKYHWAQALGLFDLSGRKNYNYYNDISKIPYLIGFNAHRLEATTNIDKNLLIVQTIDEDGNATFYKYKLKPILDAMHKPFVEFNRVDINDFKPDDTFYMPKKVKISSYQGFAYDSQFNQIIISSQRHPNKYIIDQDKTIFTPDYNKLRAIYFVPWGHNDPTNTTLMPLTNMKNTSFTEAINNQVSDAYKPITYATELEGITMFSNTSAYQLCTYHWSDSDLVKQDNLNILMHISWSYFASSDELDN